MAATRPRRRPLFGLNSADMKLARRNGAPRGLIERAVGMTSTSKEEPRLTKLKKEQAALRDKVRRTLEQCAQNRKP